MSLVLERQSDATLPVEVDGLTPDQLVGFSETEISSLKIWQGRQALEVGELFRVRGKIADDQSLSFQGDLNSVHRIGFGMNSGTIRIESAAGRHVGGQMAGGSIVAHSSVSDFAGAEMTGGTIRIAGDAGDLLGGNYPGSKLGMNRGTILVDGDAGNGVGQAMRRGTIAVAGNVGRLCGWNMLAGSILVFGDCGPECGANMIRGTIVLAGAHNYQFLPSFAPGGNYENYLFRLTANWLQGLGFTAAKKLIEHPFQMVHGDLLNGGRGEVFVATDR